MGHVALGAPVSSPPFGRNVEEVVDLTPLVVAGLERAAVAVALCGYRI